MQMAEYTWFQTFIELFAMFGNSHSGGIFSVFRFLEYSNFSKNIRPQSPEPAPAFVHSQFDLVVALAIPGVEYHCAVSVILIFSTREGSVFNRAVAMGEM
jgi:hypothetical protein